MARITGDQTIPSEWEKQYRAALTKLMPTGAVRKRFPWRLPLFQKGRYKVTAAQKTQRARLEAIAAKFATLSGAERARWYDAMPEWNSLLWYYNYFIMSGLVGNANINAGGAGVVKSIQVMKASCPKTGGHSFELPASVDKDKTVVMLYGSARKVPNVVRGDGSIATGGSQLTLPSTIDPDLCTVKLNGASYKEISDTLSAAVSPYVDALSSTKIDIKWSVAPSVAATVSYEVTEHVEGPVWPVLVSITDTHVNIDWAEEPDAAADVSIIAIEYI
jgi:hypothetical protein